MIILQTGHIQVPNNNLQEECSVEMTDIEIYDLGPIHREYCGKIENFYIFLQACVCTNLP